MTVRALLGAGLGILALGVTLLVRSVLDYLGHPLAVSSTSGVWVFRSADGTLGGFLPYALGLQPLLIGVGLVLIVATVFVGALVRSPSRD